MLLTPSTLFLLLLFINHFRISTGVSNSVDKLFNAVANRKRKNSRTRLISIVHLKMLVYGRSLFNHKPFAHLQAENRAFWD